MENQYLLYWIDTDDFCPACGAKLEDSQKSITPYSGKSVSIPICKCSSCSNNYVLFSGDKYVTELSLSLMQKQRDDYIRLKYLSTSSPKIQKAKNDEIQAENLSRQREAWKAKQQESKVNTLPAQKIHIGSANSADKTTILNHLIYDSADKILKATYGENASFRSGQYEAIENTLLHKRTLVVQKTGWGKSLVYFIVTKLLRQSGKGITFVISPLLALMENQEEAARKIGLRCASLNSKVKEKDAVLSKIQSNDLDLVLITPETLFTDEIESILPRVKVGLLVIDEAHCISDWGHDFRLEYCRLKDVINGQFRNVPVLATTATANDRVVEDLMEQLGDDAYESRGGLLRDNLYIQVLNLPDAASRLAWLVENIPKLEGSGIVYCLTKQDCEKVSEYLNLNSILSLPYYSKNGEADAQNEIALEKFKKNEIKVLVATIKLGMGYDKGDVAFIVHYQTPKNVVAYYQQIGRAGRNIDKAYTFLMTGKEDRKIHEYFIRKAFPEEREMREVLSIIRERAEIGKAEIQLIININTARLDKTLAFLMNEGYIYRTKSKKFSIAPKRGNFVYNQEHYDKLRALRREEYNEMCSLADTSECYNRYVISLLNDKTTRDCGFCANCCGEYLSGRSSPLGTEKATDFIGKRMLHIPPRKKWPDTVFTRERLIRYLNQEGICLSKYGESGFGELVSNGKYGGTNRFDEKLVIKSSEVLREIVDRNNIKHLTFVPSLRSDIVKDFSIRLADCLGIEFQDLLEKSPADQQKNMENSMYQCSNAFRSFSVKNAVVPEKVILVDDIVDSRWTLTVCGYRLGEAGCRWVFPFALAESSSEE